MLMSGRSLQDRMMSMRSSRWNRSFVRSLMEWEMSCKNNVNCQKSHGMGNVLLTEWEMSCKNNVNCQKPHRMSCSQNGKCLARTMSTVRSLTEWEMSCKNIISTLAHHLLWPTVNLWLRLTGLGRFKPMTTNAL